MENGAQQFYEGQSVGAIYWSDQSYFKVGEYEVDKIIVIMECGQMAAVPWFGVWKNGALVSKHNGALLESVDL